MNHSKKFELDIVLAAARESQGQQQRDPLASVSEEVCTEFGQCKHGLTHFPSASWCPSCVAHRAGLDRHERTGESHAGPVPTIRFDYLFTEADGQSRRDALNQLIAVLIVVDNHGNFVTCISLEKITAP